MKVILILEDYTQAMDLITDTLNRIEKKHPSIAFETIKCSNIYLANEALEKHQSIDIIITDLNMKSKGLNKQTIKNSFNGFLTGWVWLIDKVFTNENFNTTNIIVFSEYANTLKEKYGDETKLNQDYGHERIIKLISKLNVMDTAIYKILEKEITHLVLQEEEK